MVNDNYKGTLPRSLGSTHAPPGVATPSHRIRWMPVAHSLRLPRLAATISVSDIGARDFFERLQLLHCCASRRLRHRARKLVHLYHAGFTARDHDGGVRRKGHARELRASLYGMEGVKRIRRDVPHIQAPITRDGGEDGRIIRRPRCIRYVIGPRLEREQRLALLLVPQFDGPVGGA
eukprot:scaffold152408_cov33-Tisochrysis_lutea.AAC.2